MIKTVCFACALLVCSVTNAMGLTIHVDSGDPSCSSSGPGSEAQPYCSISAALQSHHAPGTEIVVHPGTYREQVTVPSSGTPAALLVLRAEGQVIVDGSDDLSSPDAWSHFKKKIWLAGAVDWAPNQVFVDGVRLLRSNGTASDVEAGEFLFVAGEGLYLNVGGNGRGDNPGTRDVRVGRRANGFRLIGRSWVEVHGFEVIRSDDKGIYVAGGSSHVRLAGNVVTDAASHGIAVAQSSDIEIEGNVTSDNANHGIAFVNEVTNSIVEGNESFRNARPNERAANGIYLYGSANNRIERNRLHDNQDTGLEITSGSHDNRSIQNVSWSNGDHGFDCIHAVNTIQVGNVAWNNYKDGFSVEGAATGTQIYDCIAVDNGLTTDEYDLYVDEESTPGFVSDHNIFWNGASQTPVRFNGTRYETIAAFAAATGHGAHSIQADPLFRDPGAGDFVLGAGSPAIDSGDAGVPFWPATDADGLPRFDDPETPNAGAGAIAYADRGAHEYFASHVAVGDGPRVPSLALSRPYPNPSAASVTLMLELPVATRVDWAILDVQGRQVWGAAEVLAAGRTPLVWRGDAASGRRAAPGLYFAHVVVRGQSMTRRILLLD